MDRDVSQFKPKARAIRTKFQETLSDDSGGNDFQISQRIRKETKPFDHGLVSSFEAAAYLNEVVHCQPRATLR